MEYEIDCLLNQAINQSIPPSRSSSPPRIINNLAIVDTTTNGNFFMVNGPLGIVVGSADT